MFLKVLELVMSRNIIQFDDTFWLQRDGTAMGTSTACMYASLYMALHERMNLLSEFQDSIEYYRRFIDDIFGIWKGNDTDWELFKARLNAFGTLSWKTSPLSFSAVFLDLNIKLGAERRLVTSTYQKPMNLYLYIPPRSAHPPGVLKSVVYGNLRRFKLQNSNPNDYIKVSTHFAERLIARGHNKTLVRDLFMEAASDLDQAHRHNRRQCHDAEPSNTLFFHQEYHPRGVPRRAIREAYRRILDGHVGFNRFIIAYSRPKNLRDALIKTRLDEPEGRRASNFVASL
jgi:hypothetical protein